MIFAKKNKLKKALQGGFTIVEVVIASSILLISVLAVTNAFSYSRRTVSRTENRLACLHIAREVMETLRSEAYASTLLTVGNKKDFPQEFFPGYSLAQRRSRGYYDVRLTTGIDGDAKDITVVINWAEPADANKVYSISLTTSHSRGLHR